MKEATYINIDIKTILLIYPVHCHSTNIHACRILYLNKENIILNTLKQYLETIKGYITVYKIPIGHQVGLNFEMILALVFKSYET